MIDTLVWFKKILINKALVAKILKISLIVTDIDGSLTDGTVHYNATGEADRMYSPQDGHGIKMAVNNGIKVAFLSGNAGSSIISRAQKIGIPQELMILGSNKDKKAAVKIFQERTGATSEQTAVFGDDVLDASVKEADPAILFAMPENGVFYLKHLADFVTPTKAGAGSAFRLFVDLILYVQEKHPDQHLIKQALELSEESTLVPIFKATQNTL